MSRGVQAKLPKHPKLPRLPKLSDELLLSVLRDARGKALGIGEILTRSGLHPGTRTAVKRSLRALTRAGRIEGEGKRYRLPVADDGASSSKPSGEGGRRGRSPAQRAGATAPTGSARDLLLGPFRASSARPARGARKRVVGVLELKAAGFGFVVPLAGGEEDVFLPASEARGVRSGDLVEVEVAPGRGGRSSGRLLGVLEQRRTHAVARYRHLGRSAQLQPLDGDLPPQMVDRSPLAHDGDLVRVRLPQRPGDEASIETVFDAKDSRILESLNVAYTQGFSDVFSSQALATAQALPPGVLSEEHRGRRDLTRLPLCTIDGEDARDFDDAVFVEAVPGGTRLLVAIADVAHYVREGSPLDVDALRRGTSVYFPDRVLPMLPERLSNDLCSLRPDVERLCLCADMVIDAHGHTKSAEIYPGVMRSAARCTYTQVSASLRGEPVALPSRVVERLPQMAKLADQLSQMRRLRGAIDFNLPEAQVQLDASGQVADVVRRERTVAHRLIEAFMLAANEAVARHFEKAQRPTVFRIHDPPDEEKLEAFLELARAHGFNVGKGQKIRPQLLDAFLRRIEGRPEERPLNSLLLRAMMQAVYASENRGHYGLGAEAYLHFTSPIRRYPDLVVHRLLWDEWAGKPPHEEAELQAVARRCSERERAAMVAEREVESFYGALFLQDRLGETFRGHVSGAIEAGVFVVLDDHLVEGMVPAEALGARARFNREQHCFMLGNGKRVGLGDAIVVTVESVNVGMRRVELSVGQPPDGASVRKRR
jgi:ribonuclease R